MLERSRQQRTLKRLLAWNSVVAILGARQVGKTTLAWAHISQQKHPANLFDLERAQDLARLDDPELALRELKGLVVLDEVQRCPEI